MRRAAAPARDRSAHATVARSAARRAPPPRLAAAQPRERAHNRDRAAPGSRSRNMPDDLGHRTEHDIVRPEHAHAPTVRPRLARDTHGINPLCAYRDERASETAFRRYLVWTIRASAGGTGAGCCNRCRKQACGTARCLLLPLVRGSRTAEAAPLSLGVRERQSGGGGRGSCFCDHHTWVGTLRRCRSSSRRARQRPPRGL